MSTKMLLLLLLSTVSSLLAFGQQLGHLDIAGTVTNATCSGEPNGAINISVAGGSPPYRYSWSIGTTSLGLTTEDISGLRGGFTYTVDVTDTQGMTGSASFLVHSEPFIVDAEIVNADCSANGSISLTPRNGVPPYSFRWDHGPTTATITNLAPGIYPVSYWDASGCSVGTKYMVEGVQNPMQLSFTKEDISCTAPTGSINLSVSGGQAPYSYRWNNGSTGEDLQGLAAGTYTVTVTDAASCSATQSIVLVEKSRPAIASTVRAATACEPGLADGGIQVQVSGGTSPYSYRWADGANTADRSGLQAGNYALTVVDAQGCAAAVEIVVPHAPVYPVIVFSTSANVACDANYTGSITAQINFTNSYSYSLIRNEAVVAAGGQVTSTDLYFASLSPGTYQLEVQQSNGCAVRTEIVVGEEAGVPVINAVTATPQGHCTFGDGTAAVTGISYNGTADRISDYVYTWTDASGTVVASSAYASNLPAGTYFVTAVKLSNPGSGCSSAPIEVVVPYEPSYATIELSSTPNTSCSTSFYNGTISAVFVSNYATYTWNWSKSGGR